VNEKENLFRHPLLLKKLSIQSPLGHTARIFLTGTYGMIKNQTAHAIRITGTCTLPYPCKKLLNIKKTQIHSKSIQEKVNNIYIYHRLPQKKRKEKKTL
jgi:hypothetical protein